MKLKCIKTSITNPDITVTNSDMEGYLVIGELFLVYGIRFYENTTYVYIFNDRHLFEVPIELFEVIDDKVPDKWRIRIEDGGNVTMWPDLFYKDKFLENFAEHELKERELFKVLSVEIGK